ncbi:hypothetical protein EBZ38_04780 [bacterium]|nr:hypothetical protein [bacterium]
MTKNAIAVLLIMYGIFGNSLFYNPDKPNPPSPPPSVAILNIDKPTEAILSKVQKFSDLITDPTDRAKLAIFNHQFATRVINYETNVQKLNDVYVLAGKNFFKDSIHGKYKELPDMIINLIKDTTTDENHILTNDEKNQISQNFMGVAWVLIQKK